MCMLQYKRTCFFIAELCIHVKFCSALCVLFAVVVIDGHNRTVDESEGSVDLCFTMEQVAEVSISIHLNFGNNIDSGITPAQG